MIKKLYKEKWNTYARVYGADQIFWLQIRCDMRESSPQWQQRVLRTRNDIDDIVMATIVIPEVEGVSKFAIAEKIK